jgi:hypothetical protein
MSLKCRENRMPEGFSRLATVRRLVAPAAVLSLAAVSLAACGGGTDAKLLPGATAAEITENLALVERYVEEDECVGARDAAAEIAGQIEALQDVDPKLKEALQRGSDRLDEVVASCEEEAPEATTTEEEVTKPEHPAPSEQEKQEEKEEKEREKEERELEKEEEKEERETPAEEPPAEETPPPSEGGGTNAPGGVSPGAPAGGN